MMPRISKMISIICCAFLLVSCTADNTASSWDLTSKQIDIIRGAHPGRYPAVAKDRGNTLVVGSTDFNGVFNPIIAETAYDITAATNIFGSLLEPDFDAKPIAGMADYIISEDGLTYTLTLKKGIIFSSGQPVTTKDIEFTLYVLCDPSYNGSIDICSINIVGYDEYHLGNAKNISGISIVNDETIEIKLEKPDAQAIWCFSSGVLSREYYGKDFTKGKLEGNRNLFDKPMGAGPYKMVEYKLGERITLAANEQYYKGVPKIADIVYSVSPLGQELDRVKNGEADIDFPTVNPQNNTLIGRPSWTKRWIKQRICILWHGA